MTGREFVTSREFVTHIQYLFVSHLEYPLRSPREFVTGRAFVTGREFVTIREFVTQIGCPFVTHIGYAPRLLQHVRVVLQLWVVLLQLL